jgi:hypothetical protein
MVVVVAVPKSLPAPIVIACVPVPMLNPEVIRTPPAPPPPDGVEPESVPPPPATCKISAVSAAFVTTKLPFAVNLR